MTYHVRAAVCSGPLPKLTCACWDKRALLGCQVLDTTTMKKYALITGAASGIGYQMAIALHKRGYTVFGVAPEVHAFGMNLLQKEIGLTPIVCDITNTDDIKRAVKVVADETGGYLDILYNNAGISTLGGPAIEYDDALVRRLFDVNTIGHMFMTKYFGEMVIRAKGTIVFTASVAALVPLSWVSAYCATKAAIDQYALVLRGEMAPFGVKVYSVITGGVNTAICDPLNTPVLRSDLYNVEGVYESIQASAMMSRNTHTSIPASRYAEQVARQITKKRNVGFNIYRGYAAYLLHLLRRWAPLWFCEWGIQWHFKQRRVFRGIKARVKAEAAKKLL